jgi:DNA-binding transcriptional ArsR family regulator
MQSLAAIADPTRRRIVELLAEGDRSSGELARQFAMSAPAVSQHLNVLRKAGLITTRVAGKSRIQSLNPAGFDELEAWLQRTRAFWSRSLDALERELQADEKSKSAPAPNPAVAPGPIGTDLL